MKTGLRFFAFCLALFCSVAVFGQNKVYITSSTAGEPWGSTTNDAAMDGAFGSGNWQHLYYESVSASSLFSTCNGFIYLEGGANNDTYMANFITANLTAMQNWVSNGGRLFLNAAPWDEGMDYGFGGVTLNWNSSYTDASSQSYAVSSSYTIFNSPQTSVGTTWTGGYFAHAYITGSGLTSWIVDGSSRMDLAEMSYGNGIVVFGSMTADGFHSPQPQAHNLLINILSYLTPAPVTCTTPTISCPSTITTAASGASCNAVVTYSNPVVTGPSCFSYAYSLSGATSGSGTGTGSGLTYNKGTTTVALTVTSPCGTANCSFNIVVTSPVAAITGNGNTITSGSATTSTTNGTDFGNTGGVATAHTFTIKNSGTGTLNLGSISIGGTNASDYAITTGLSSTSLSSGSTATFAVTFTGSAVGTRTCTVSVPSNDCNSPFSFALSGSVQAGGYLNFNTSSGDYISINNSLGNFGTGDFTIQFNFRTSSTQTMYFLSKRSGCGGGNFISMQIGGNGQVAMETDDNTNYTGLGSTSSYNDGKWHQYSAVRKNGILTLYIDGSSVASGASAANLNNTNLLTIGEGSCTGQNPSIVYNGDLDEMRFWSRALCTAEISNNQTCELGGTQTNLVAYYKFDEGFSGGNNSGVTSLTDAEGSNTGTLNSFSLSGSSSNWINGGISGSCAAFSNASAAITGNSTAIANGATTTVATNGTNFGSVGQNTTTTQTYTISNTGNTALTIGAISFSGTNASDFTVSTAPATSVAVNGSTTFVISFKPSTSSTESGTISIVTSDCNNNPYTYTLSGTGLAPAGALNFDGTNDFVLVPHDTTLVVTNALTMEAWVYPTNNSGWHQIINKEFDWEMYTVNGVFEYAISTAGSNSWPAAVVGNLPLNTWSHVAVTYDGTTAKAYINGSLTTTTSRSGTISNTRLPYEVGWRNSTGSGGPFAGNIDEVRVWNRALCQGEIQNSMDCELGSGQTGLISYFKFDQGYINYSNSGVATATDASASGKNGTLENFALTGATSNWTAGATSVSGTCSTFLNPVTALTGNSTSIPNGQKTASSSNNTNLGNVAAGTIFQTYTIQNTGNTTLTVSSIGLSGSNPTNFVVGGLSLPVSIATNGSATFTVSFTANNTVTPGTYGAIVTVNNNDCNNPQYTFAIQAASTCVIPSVSSQPASSTVCSGTGTSFSVTAAGTLPTYQWMVNTGSGFVNTTDGSQYTGSITATLSLAPTTGSMDNYQYECVVTGQCGSPVTSSAATLRVNSVTAATVNNSTVCAGTNAVFTVSPVNTGTATLSYQWQVNTGTGFTNIPSATASSLTVSAPASTADNNLYQCLVTSGSCAAFTSTSGTLRVNAVTSASVANETVCNGANAVFSATVTNTGTGALAYQWYSNGSAISGATASSYTVAASPSNNNSSYVPTVSAGGCPAFTVLSGVLSYTIYSTHNGNGSTTQYPDYANSQSDMTSIQNTSNSNTVQKSTGTISPSVGLNWSSYTVLTSAGISIPNSGDYFSTKFVGNFIPKETGTYVFGIGSDDASDLLINGTLVTSDYGGHGIPGAPGNTGSISMTAGTSYTFIARQQEFNGGEGLVLVWKRPSQSSYSLQTDELNPQGILSVNSVTAASINNQTVCSGATATFTVSPTSTGPAALTYQWQLSTNSGASYTAISGATASSYAQTLTTSAMDKNLYECIVAPTGCSSFTSTPGTLRINSVTAATVAGQTTCAGTNATFTVVPTATGTGALTYQWFSFNGTSSTIISGATGSTYTPSATAANDNSQYNCVVSSGGCSGFTSNNATLRVNSVTSAAVNNQTVCAGTDAVFNVTPTSTGTAALSYQWYLSTDGGNHTTVISGANASSYTASAPASGSDGYEYMCVVTSGSCTPFNSGFGILRVNAVTAASVSGQTTCAGTNVAFTVSTTNTGTAALSYQWQLSTDGGSTYNNIASANAATYTVTTPLASADKNQYLCIVTSGACTAFTSTAGTLRVNSVTAATVSNQTVCASTNAVFTVVPTSTGPAVLSYQWQISTGGAFSNISGATASTYTVTAPGFSSNGYQYQCLVSSGSCTAFTSNAGTLTVNTAPVFTACPSNTSASTTTLCSQVINYTSTATGSPVPVLTYSFSGATTGSGSGTGSGSTFNRGVTTVTVTATNVCGAPTCTFNVTVTTPITKLIGNGNQIVNGASTTSTSTATNFGSRGLNIMNSETYTIANTGNAPLILNGISFSGAAASDFFVSSSLASTVAANSSTTFTVTFDPSVVGTRTAVINIATNDICNSNNLYSFAVSGIGLAPMHGTYTICALGCNYGSFGAAVADMNLRGVDGAITFKVGAGTYNEAVSISDIPGVSSVNTLSFVGTSAANTIITNASTVLTLNSCSYVSFSGFTFNGTSGNYTIASNSTGYCSIINCNVNSSSSSQDNIYDYGSSYFTVSNDHISGGSDGIYTQSGNNELFTKNRIVNFAANGIWSLFSSENEVSYNTIDSAANTNTTDVGFQYDAGLVLKDNAMVAKAGEGMFLAYLNYYDNSVPSQVINNFVANSPNGPEGNIDVDGTAETDVTIAHNTFYGNANSTTFYLFANSNTGTGVQLVNNIFYGASSTSPVVDFSGNLGSSGGPFTLIDGNDYYNTSTGGLALLNGNTYSSVSAIQSAMASYTYTSPYTHATGIKFETSATNVLPSYINTETNFHFAAGAMPPFGVNAGISTDINGTGRATSAPTAGAVELICTTPIFTACPANIVTSTSAISCNAVVNYTSTTSGYPVPVITYTLAGATTASGNGSGNRLTFNKGVTNVTITATNSCGTATCTFSVTMNDNTNPIAKAKNFTASLDTTGNATITAANVNNGSTDNCGIASMTVSPSSFNCSNLGSNNTVTLTVTDLSGNVSTATATVTVKDTIAPGGGSNLASILGAAPSVALSNVPEAKNFGVLYQVNIGTNQNYGTGAVTYAVNNAAKTGLKFNRLAYMYQLDGNWVWVSMDTLTTNLTKLGIPNVTVNPVVWQQKVSNMNVYSNVASVTTGTGITTGNVEMWTDCYTEADGLAGIGGNSSTYDFNDSRQNANCYGSFQVNNWGAGQTIMAWNDFTGGGVDDVGIGNDPSGTNPDWTFQANAASYTTRTLYILVGSTNGVKTNNVTAYLDASGNASVTPAQIDNHNTDNCTIASRTLDKSSFTCSNLGNNTVTLTLTDESGNASQATATVTVKDTIKPKAVAQNVTIFLDATGHATTTASAINNGSADNNTCTPVTLALSQTTFTCTNLGVNNVVLTVTDASGNSSTANATVTVRDIIAPTAVAQNVTIFLDANGNATTTASAVNNGSRDNNTCTPVSLSLSKTAFTCTNLGSNPVILTVTDASGNASQANATVTVRDIIAPNAQAQNVTIALDASGNASTTAAAVNHGSTDNNTCTPVTLALSKTAFNCSNLGNNPVTLTVTDASGNASQSSATVTVIDNIAPTVLTQNVTVYLDATGSASITTAMINNGSTDNCTISGMSLDKTSFNCSNLGPNTVNLTVTDESDNSNHAAAIVTVKDTTRPIMATKNVTIYLDATGSASINTTMINNGTTDNCTVANLSLDKTSFNCSNLGPNTVTLTATDESSNSNHATAIVTVKDTTRPIMATQNVTIYLDATGSASINTTMINNGTTDNCTVSNLVLDKTSFNCSNLGANTVTLTATDESNNSNHATATITVLDTTRPIMATQAVTVYLDANGAASITPAMVNNGTSDNCTVSNLVLDKTSFNCSNLGANTVTLTATDESNNSNHATATITVLDTTRPIMATQAVTVYLDANGAASITPAMVNNGTSDNCTVSNLVLDKTTFNCSNLGANTVTLTATDESSNSNHATATITVLDTTRPIMATQALTVYLDANGAASITPAMVNNGTSDNCTVSSLVLDKTTFNCSNLGANTVTLTATDESNNSNHATATITVLDTTRPIMATQAVTVYLDATGSATITPAMVNNGTSDNCTVSNLVLDKTSFNCSNLGANTVTLTATDESNNSNHATATITVLDTTRPIMATQAVTVYLDANGAASITPAMVNNGTSDNCTVSSLVLDKTTFNCSNLGANTVTLTATDESNNSNHATATITVLDTTRPIMATQAVTVYLDANGAASITPAMVNNGTSDNCTVSSLVLDKTTFNCSNLGANTVTLTATDESNNSNHATATITVLDTTRPIMATQAVTVYLDANGAASITPAMVNNGTSDNCTVSNLVLDKTTFNCSNLGANTVTLTATDESSNSNHATATITVLDTTRPIMATQAVTVYLDATGSASITPAMVNNGSSDNCTVASLSLDKTTFNCSNLGANTVTLTATDESNNSNHATATITVLDTTRPIMATQAVTVYLDANGAASITPAMVNNGTSDNCTVSSLVLDQTSFNCSNLGANTVTLTATDESNNSNHATATITVLDTTRPIMATQAVTVYLDANGAASITPAMVNNGTSDNCTVSSLSLDKTSFNCSNLGANTVTLTATDESNNSNHATATITVLDTTRPIMATQAVTVYLDANGAASITPAMVNNGSSDNCTVSNLSLDKTSFNCSNLGANTVTLTATDESNNSNHATATITVLDTTRPIMATQALTVYLDATGSATITPAMVNNGTSDNCTVSSLSLDKTSFNCSNLGANTVTLTATDESNNSNHATATITVLDTTRPIMATQAVTVYLDATGSATITPAMVNNGTTDNCTVSSLSLDNSSFNCDNLGANTVTLTAIDESNNSNSATATVTVKDSTRPTVITRNITVDLLANGKATITPAMVNNGSFDNCGIASMSLDKTVFSCANTGVNVVMLTITDGSGNLSTASATVTVKDTIPPTVKTKKITVYLDATGNVTITPSSVDNGTFDNCTFALSLDKTSFNCNNLGASTVKLTATDASGNISTGTTTITVKDTIRPTVVTKNATVYLDATGKASIVTDNIDNGSTDNCSVFSRTLNNSSFTCANLGANTVTLTVTDESGNVNTGNATVTVKDTTRPIMATQNVTVYLDANGKAAITTQMINNGSSDNCTITNFALNTSSFTCGNLGANTVKLTATDESGNTNYKTAIVTVKDTSKPVVVVQNVIAYLDATGKATITTATINNGTTDNCTVSSLKLSNSSFTCSNEGNNTVTLTATDESGNTASKTAIVTVKDTTRPVVVTKNILITLNSSNAASIAVSDINNGSYDNCTISTLSLSKTSFSCSNVGANTVTLTVTDNSGNVGTGTAIVTVKDPTPPVARAKNITVYLNSSGTVTVAGNAVDNGSSDNCSVVSYTLSQSTFTCSNLGSNKVTLTVADAWGNTATATCYITVIDNTAPVARTKNITAYLNASGSVAVYPSQIDNGSSDNCSVTLTFATNSHCGTNNTVLNYNCNDIGTLQATLVATDPSGNYSTANATITILDTMKPVIKLKNITVNLGTGQGCQSNGSDANITESMIDNGSSDNCSVVSVVLSQSNFTCSNIGANTVTVTMKDASGNTSTATAVVTVKDVTAPVARAKNATVYLNASGSATVSTTNVDNGSTDNCSIASEKLSVTSFTCANLGNNTVTLTVTDPSGNSATANATVTVVDNTAPVAKAMNATVYLDATGKASIKASALNNGSTDNCGVVMAFDHDGDEWTNPNEDDLVKNFTCSNIGTNSVTVYAVDKSNNYAAATVTVAVLDTISPVVKVNNLTLNLGSTGTAALTTSQVNNNSSDNCSISSMTLSKTSFSCANVGTNYVTFTVTDPSGNSSSATAVITVKDVTAPVAKAKNITVNLSASGTATIATTDIDNGSTDNCSIASESLSKTSFTCANVGNNTVTLTVTDPSGNKGTASAVVTVKDITAPVAKTQNVTVYLNASGSATLLPSQIDGGSSDNCSVSLTFASNSHCNSSNSQLTYSCSDIGSLQATLVATDPSGNYSTANATVTVKDTTAPVVKVKNINVTLNSSGKASITVASINNGSYDNCSIASESLDVTSFTCANVGANTVTLTVTDPSGNKASATAIVTVSTSLAVDAGSSQTVYYGYSPYASATLSATASGGSGGSYSYKWSTGAKTSSITVSPTSTTMYYVTISDGNGCTATDSVQVAVVDVHCGTGNSGVIMCLNKSTICVSQSDVPTYLKKGAKLGPCSGYDPISQDMENLYGLTLNAYPNPFNESTVISFTVSGNDAVSLDLYNVKGDKIKNIYAGQTEINNIYTFDLKPGNIPSGVYMVRLTTPTEVKYIKLVKLD